MSSSNIFPISLTITALLAIAGAVENRCVTHGRANCEMTPEETEGPLFIPHTKYQSDVREGRPGIRLDLQLTFQNVHNCTPIQDLNIHIWSTDARGIYSGGQVIKTPIRNPPHDKSRYMRGIQTTDSNGIVKFSTIVPGWYAGRTTHIHVEAFKDKNDDVMGIYTTQLYFSEELMQKVEKNPAYQDDKNTRVKNNEDSIFVNSQGPKLVLKTKKIGKTLNEGLKAQFVLSINKASSK